MAINTALLIAAPMLQDYFVDNVNAEAMSAGIITMYQDNSRTTLKNWYYQSGSPGAYTYVALDNPLTLSAVGTITDPNGNDTIPFFYPYSETDNQTFEPYYVTVIDSNGQMQFTRQNFPFIPQEVTPFNTVPTLENYVINGEFWRNVGTMDLSTLTLNPLSGVLSALVAPSQHDGFNMPDWEFIKSKNGATESVTFTKFALGTSPLIGTITPEYYLNHACTVLVASETSKVYQVPISLHIKTLESVQASINIWAQSVSGANQITISIYQFLGTGVSSPNPIVLETITLNASWTKYEIQFTFPSAAGAILGAGGDDALYLQIGMPLSQLFNLNFAKPLLFLSEEAPTNSFETYDQVDTIINSPRTGDLRESANAFYPYGWIPLNDGSIGNASSSATTRANADTWQIYNLLWNSISNTFCPVSTGRGSSAIADFNANKTLTLFKAVGRVLATAEVPALSYNKTYTTNFAVNNNLTSSDVEGLYTGSPVLVSSTVSLSSPLVANTFYYAIVTSSTTIELATTPANAYLGTPITLTGNGSGTQSIYSYILGTYEGQESHALRRYELPDPLTNTAIQTSVGVGALPVIGDGGAYASGTVSNQGGNILMPLMQYTTYINRFIKL